MESFSLLDVLFEGLYLRSCELSTTIMTFYLSVVKRTYWAIVRKRCLLHINII